MNLGFPIGTKVRIHTTAGGCYDGITGRVTSSLAPFDTLFNPRPRWKEKMFTLGFKEWSLILLFIAVNSLLKETFSI